MSEKVTVNRSDIYISEHEGAAMPLASANAPRYWLARLDGYLSTGESVSTIAYRGSTPKVALKVLEAAIEGFGWVIADA